MRTFQRNALMTMGNLRPSTPSRGLEVACYLLPLELQLRKIACESYVRCKNFEIVPLNDTYTFIESHKGHRQLCEEFLRDLDIYLLDCPNDRAAKTTYFLNNKFEVDFDSMVNKGDGCYGYPQFDAKLTIYTDGSLVKKPLVSAGAGLRIFQGYKEEGYRLGPDITVWQSELYAVKKAAQFLIKNASDLPEMKEEVVVIYLDSMAAIKALGNIKTRSKLVIRTNSLLNAAAKQCKKLIIRWVKSHQSDPQFIGNQISDFIANSHAKNPEIPIAYDVPKPAFATFKSLLSSKVDDLWGQYWRKLDHGRQTKEFFPIIEKGRSHKILCQPKKVFSKLLQCLSGHAFLAKHNAIVGAPSGPSHYGPQLDPECRLCNVGHLQTPAHLLSECGYFLLLRAQIFEVYTLHAPYNTLPISKIIKFLQQSKLSELNWEDDEANNSA